jgi:hypothetical protein
VWWIEIRVWIPAVLPLLAVAGCTTWVRPGTTEDKFHRDPVGCEYHAAKATANLPPGYAQSFNKFDVKEQCMRIKGYHREFR